MAEDSTRLLLSIRDAAEVLGVSTRTVWTLAHHRGLPHVRVGRRILFPVEGLRHWVASHTRSTEGPGNDETTA